METHDTSGINGETVAARLEANWAAATEKAPRLITVNNLRRHFGSRRDIDPQADWIYAEANPRPNTASIGLELEIWWSHILPAEYAETLTSGKWQQLSEYEKQAFNAQVEPIGYPHIERCNETMKLGVPSRGKDGLWEFSHRPAWHYKTLIEEVLQLVDAGLVPERKSLPMHITLGGIEADHRIQFLLRILELAGNSSVQRLAYPDSSSGWARRGTAGVASRSRWKLELEQRQGAELRTLLFQDIEQLERLLSRVQNAGSMIREADKGNINAINSWQSFVAAMERLTAVNIEDTVWVDPFANAQKWSKHVQMLNSRELEAGINQIFDEFVL